MKTAVAFAYATEEAALEVASKIAEETVVVACHVQDALGPLKDAACWVIVPVNRPLIRS